MQGTAGGAGNQGRPGRFSLDDWQRLNGKRLLTPVGAHGYPVKQNELCISLRAMTGSGIRGAIYTAAAGHCVVEASASLAASSLALAVAIRGWPLGKVAS